MVESPARPAQEVIGWALEKYGKELAICTSFQKSGSVIIDMASKFNLPFRVFTLDTGRLPEETYQILETVRQRYGLRVETVAPDTTELEQMSIEHGPELFRRSVANRLLCCQIRKVRPLGRKLRGFRAYMVGLRRGQTADRATLPQVDDAASPVKISPLLDWSRQEVDDYIRLHDVPIHPLYEKGYTSIGCAPCTRAVLPGEDERAGRWWWEEDGDKECGIHFRPDGTIERTVDVLLRDILPAGSEEDIGLGFDAGL